jgi:hypothetical protein
MAQYILANFGRGWKIWLATVPIIALSLFNLDYYGGSDSALALLTPIWLALFVLSIIGTVTIFACAGMMETPAGESIRTGLKVAAARLPQLILLLLITFFIPSILFSRILTIAYPLTFVIPAVTALAMGRLVLDTLGLEYPRPNEPTEERLREKRSH